METLQRVFAEHPFAHGLDERHLALLTGVLPTSGSKLVRYFP